MRFSRTHVLCGVVASVVLMPVHRAGAGPYDPPRYDPQFEPSAVVPWVESANPIPPYPEERDLLPIPLNPRDTLKLYLDERSLSLGADGVVRLTLVVESARGARNVFYDGIRCETREYKTYAVGASGVLKPRPEASWRAINSNEAYAFRYHLYKHYVCDAHTQAARTPAEMVRAIERQSVPN